MTKEFSSDHGREHCGSNDSLVLYGDDPQLDIAVGKHTDGERSSPPLSWEILPPEETRVAGSVLVHPKAQSILTAFIGKATKTEIARVYGVKEKLVRSVIAAAQQQVKSL